MSLRGGRYELLDTIAAGGMATVHLGRALGAGGFERLVAVKTMHPHLAKEAEFVAMFLDEARLAARIRHPNVVATLDIQQDDEGLFLVMEYVEGPSLSRVLKALARDNKRLPLGVALRVFMDTLAGLHAAHELTGSDGEPLRLIHRDMSPHNVLVGADGVARITDFGIARAESRLASTRTGSIKGKTMYLAPEQVRSEPLDRRTDIYAAGAVLWEILTGERLVKSDSEVGMMHQIVEADRKAPHEVHAEVPEAISKVCMRALERDMGQRFPTAIAFSEAVEKAAAEAGISPAAPRAVAELVRGLGVHKAPVDLPPPSVSAMSRAPSSVASPAPAPSAPSSEARQAVTAVDNPAPSTTRATFEAPSDPGPPPRRGRAGIVVGAALVAGGLAAGFLLVKSGVLPGSEKQTTGASTGAATAEPSPSSQPAPSVMSAPVPSPSPSTAPSPSATASATSTAAAAVADTRPTGPRDTTARPPVTGAPRSTSAPTSKTFRPKEL